MAEQPGGPRELPGSPPTNSVPQALHTPDIPNIEAQSTAADIREGSLETGLLPSPKKPIFTIKITRLHLFWLFLILLVTGLTAGLIGLGVRLAQTKHEAATSGSSNTAATTTVTTGPSTVPTLVSISPSPLSETVLQPTDIPPVEDAGLGAGVDVLGTYFTGSSGSPQTILAYDGGNGRLCVRTNSGSIWLNNVQCVEGANPIPNTPITVLDWLGGPSIYFIAKGNLLSGIDNIPLNNSWRLSSLAAQNVATHSLSQLGSVTWLNGTSSWIYYQDPNSQMREFGMVDYRDQTWRDGSVGVLGLALNGTGIGVARWLKDGGEVMELFMQVAGDAVHARLFISNAWTSDWYDIDGAPGAVADASSLTAATIDQADGSMVLLAYISKTGFITVQSRGTINITDYSTYSTPQQLVEGDSSSRTGLAAISLSGAPKVYFVNNQTILELSGTTVTAANWTTKDISAL